MGEMAADALKGGSKANYKNILVVKLADIGDLLTATPALRAIRETFPSARITLLATPSSAPVLAGSPLIDRTILFEKHAYDRFLGVARLSSLKSLIDLLIAIRRERYDCVVILHHLVTRWGTLKYAALALASGARCRVGLDNGRGWFLTQRATDMGFGARHEVEYCLEAVAAIGAKTADLALSLSVAADDLAKAGNLLNADDARPLVAIHPGSGQYSLLRRWPAERFAMVGDALAATGARIVLLGGADEVELCEDVARKMRFRPQVLTGQTSLPQLAAVLSHCSLLVGNDSGVMHVAAALGIPVVAIFGPSNHRAWGPWIDGRPLGEEPGPRGAVVRGEALCAPCLYGVDWRGRQPRDCDVRCWDGVTPEMVVASVRAVLAAQVPERVLTKE